MIKIIAIGFWVCIAALGSSYLTAVLTAPHSAEAKKAPDYFDGLDYRKTDGIAVPIIDRDQIAGYVLATFVYTIDGATAAKLAVPPEPFIVDEAYRAVYSASNFDFKHPERYDITALTNSIKDAVNARYKKEMVHEILVQQFDFLPKDSMGGEGAKGKKT